jgi:hypothetical protein
VKAIAAHTAAQISVYFFILYFFILLTNKLIVVPKKQRKVTHSTANSEKKVRKVC